MATAEEKAAKQATRDAARSAVTEGKQRLQTQISAAGKAFSGRRLRSAGDLSRYSIGGFLDDPLLAATRPPKGATTGQKATAPPKAPAPASRPTGAATSSTANVGPGIGSVTGAATGSTSRVGAGILAPVTGAAIPAAQNVGPGISQPVTGAATTKVANVGTGIVPPVVGAAIAPTRAGVGPGIIASQPVTGAAIKAAPGKTAPTKKVGKGIKATARAKQQYAGYKGKAGVAAKKAATAAATKKAAAAAAAKAKAAKQKAGSTHGGGRGATR